MMEELNRIIDRKVSVMISYQEVLQNPNMLLAAAQGLYVADIETPFSKDELWDVFQALIGTMVSDPNFPLDDLYAWPTSVELGVDVDDRFFMALDSGYLFMIEESLPINGGIPVETIFDSLPTQDTQEDFDETLRITEYVMKKLPAQYKDKVALLRPVYLSEIDKDGRLYGELVNKETGELKLLVEYTKPTRKLIFTTP